MTSLNGNVFRVTGHLCGEFTGQWRRCFFLICAWTSGWVNNAKVGDLRPHRAHNDITLMHFLNFKTSRLSSTSKYQRKYRYLDNPICISLTFLLCLVVATLHQYHLITYVGYTPLEKMCRKKWKRIFSCSHSAMIIFEYVYFSKSWAKTHVRDESGLVLRLLLILQKRFYFSELQLRLLWKTSVLGEVCQIQPKFPETMVNLNSRCVLHCRTSRKMTFTIQWNNSFKGVGK